MIKDAYYAEEFDRSLVYMKMDPYTAKWVLLTAVLTLMLALNVLTYLESSRNHNYADGDPFSLRQVVKQLAKGLSDVNIRQENLNKELEKVAIALPILINSKMQSEESVQQSVTNRKSHEADIRNYDLQVPDYALESAGGRILDTGDTVPYYHYDSVVTWTLLQLTSIMCKGCDGARAILQPSSLPGECWAFKGSKGEVVIQLLGMVTISGVSLEHIPANIAPTKEISSAPRAFRLEGLGSRYAQEGEDLGKFEFNKNGNPIQYFEVLNPSNHAFNIVRLKILSNWGNPRMTCVYRVRIHGELFSGIPIASNDRGDNS